MPDPIEKMAEREASIERLVWDMAAVLKAIGALEQKVDRIADAEINQLKLQISLMNKDVEALKADAERRVSDNRWLIGAVLGPVAAIVMWGISLIWRR